MIRLTETEKSTSYYLEARRIIDLIKKDFINSQGALSLKRVDQKVSSFHIFPDMGDFLPFFLYFGEDQFISSQINIFQKTLKNKILFSEFKSMGIPGLAKSYEYSDLVFGLIDYDLSVGSQQSKELLDEQVKIMINIFNYSKNINSFYHPILKRLPILDSRDGMMIELFVELYKIKKEDRFLNLATNVYGQLVSSAFYKKYKIFPTLGPKSYLKILPSKKFKEAEIAKVNTNTLYGILELYKVKKDEGLLKTIDQTVDAVIDKSIDGAGVMKTFTPKNPNYKKAFLTSSFMMLDFLCDLYQETRDNKYLNIAQKIADYWINLQSKSTGLFPMYSNSNKTFLDSETDMAIALYKLFEITDNQKYQEAADTCYDGIIKYHGSKDYVLSVNVDSGETMDGQQKTKFLALFLKLLILKMKLDQGEKIYVNQDLFNLIKDR